MSREHKSDGIEIVAAAVDHLMKVEAERDAYRDAIAAIPRHRATPTTWAGFATERCDTCVSTSPVWWPCPVERAHRLIEGTP